MSGADIATMALRIFFQHRRAGVIECQLREIDLLMQDVPDDPHLDRMCQRAHVLRDVEYCEDVGVHLRAVRDAHNMARRADDDAHDMCRIIIGICWDTESVEHLSYQMGSASMSRVNALLDIIVNPFVVLRPWAREHLDLHRLGNWYNARGLVPTRAEFREIRLLISARTA